MPDLRSLIVFLILNGIQFAIGIIGYLVWKDPTRRMIKIGFVSAIVLFAISILPIILTGTVDNSGNVLLLVDSVVSMIIAVGYVVGSVIVRSHLDMAREKRVN